MGGVGNRAIRVKEKSKLLVEWMDVNGLLFTEQTETHDISETGISFYLKNLVWVDTHLTLKISSSELFGPVHITTAKVVRVQTGPTGGQLVATRFDN
jgi:hypothetical protein